MGIYDTGLLRTGALLLSLLLLSACGSGGGSGDDASGGLDWQDPPSSDPAPTPPEEDPPAEEPYDPPAISITGGSVVEGDSGNATVLFTVELANSVTREVSVAYVTEDADAVAGSDYVATSGSLVFSPGETSKSIYVLAIGDTEIESDEFFRVILSNASNATIAVNAGLGMIENDDVAPPLVEEPPVEEPPVEDPYVPPNVTISGGTVTEGDAGTVTAVFTVSLSASVTRDVSVNYATEAGDATAGTDFIAASGSLVFSAGETSRTIDVQVVGDTEVETDETFRVRLTSATDATITTDSAVGTIENDDVATPPQISVSDVTVSEGDTGTTTARFTVTLDVESADNVSVDYATSNGSASAGTDYAQTVGTLTLTPGQTSAFVDVDVYGDTLQEGAETFVLALSNPENATLNDNSATATIQDDDEVRSVTLSWQSPTTNADDSCIGGDLEGYTVYAGTQSSQYSVEQSVSLGSGEVTCEQTDYDSVCGEAIMTCSYQIDGLELGTWYFAVRAYDYAGNNSPFSNEVQTLLQ